MPGDNNTDAVIVRLKGIIGQTLAAMEALHPSAAGDMSDADYARLWNATMKQLEQEVTQHG